MKDSRDEGERLAKRLVDKLYRTLSASRGKLSRATKEAGVGINYPRERLEQGTMDLARFCSLVLASGHRVTDFVAQSLNSDPLGDLVESPEGEVPEIVRKGRQRADQDVEQGSIDRSHLMAMDDLRYDDPVKARDGIATAIEFIASRDVPLALGVYASCCRPLLQFREAWFALRTAMQLAVEGEQASTIANLMQRAAVLHLANLENQKALIASERATVAYARIGEQGGIAQTLIDQGSIYWSMGKLGEVEASCRQGLALLSPTDRRHRCAGLHLLALVLYRREEFGEALEALEAPTAGSRVEEGKMRWLEACCLGEVGRASDALQSFEQAFELLAPTAPADAALLVCDHVRFLLALGRLRAAVESARAMRSLIIPLEDRSPQIAAAALELASIEFEGEQELTVSFVESVKTRIEEARKQAPTGFPTERTAD